MKKIKRSKKGFTLIEILVAVLIIGILAAIAVPQYQKARRRTTLSKMYASVRQLYDAQNAFYLANGRPARNFAELDLEFPQPRLNAFSASSSEPESCAWGSQLNPIPNGDSWLDMGDYEFGMVKVWNYDWQTSLACFKDKCWCVGIPLPWDERWIENEEKKALAGKFICYAGYKNTGSFCGKIVDVGNRVSGGPVSFSVWPVTSF